METFEIDVHLNYKTIKTFKVQAVSREEAETKVLDLAADTKLFDVFEETWREYPYAVQVVEPPYKEQ
jgi:hypothetical protein